MGVVNVTPDSFSDGGLYLDHDAAIAHGLELVAEGADVVDVGGESTRPGAEPVPVEEELRRVRPGGRSARPPRAGLHRHPQGRGGRSGDRRRRHAGQRRVGRRSTRSSPPQGRRSAGSPCTCSATRARCSATPRTTTSSPRSATSSSAGPTPPATAGVREVWIDPGIGFGKTPSHNWSLLRHLDVLVATGYPVVVGTSRKRFLGEVTAASDGRDDGRSRRRSTTGWRPPWRPRRGRWCKAFGWCGCMMCGQRCTPPRWSPAEQDRSGMCRA